MNSLGANMKLIVECSQKLVRLGENLWGKEQKLDKEMQEHQKLCDEIMAIQEIEPIEAEMEEDDIFDGTVPLPDSFVERMVHKIADSELFKAEPLDIPTMTTDFVKEHGLPCPEGYIFKDENGNVINATKIVLEKKKTNKEMTENNTKVDMGEVSDGYHTFNELYEYRMLYNAALFNEFAKQGLYDVHKSRKHSDGEYPFGDSNWFIVMAELPTGQISNHYEMKDWDKFQIPEKPLANKWDEHSPRDVADRLTSFTNPKKEYPKTYEECLKILGFTTVYTPKVEPMFDYDDDIIALQKLKHCRDAYWKIAGDWKPEYPFNTARYVITNSRGFVGNVLVYDAAKNYILEFPTAEMRDAFYENFKELIEQCKELL